MINEQTFFDHLFLDEREYDVIVVGGGAGGIAAASTSARLGRKTLLIEKNGFLGGAAVAGLSGTLCGMYTSSKEKKAEQIVFGFCDEFVGEMKKVGGVTPPQKYGNTFVVTHDPLKYKMISEQMVLDSGAEILLHACMIAAFQENGCVKSVIVNTKSGYLRCNARQFIDASGDGDLAFRSGFAYTVGDHGKIQNPTMIFRMGNVDLKKLKLFWGEDTLSPAIVTDQLREARLWGMDLPREKVWIFPMPNGHEVLMNTTRIVGADSRELNVLNEIDYSEAEIEGRKQQADYARFFRENIEGFETAYTVDTGCEVRVRQTRSITGIEKLTNNDVIQCAKPGNGIVKSCWPIELHSGEKPKVHWLLDDYYTVPMGALVPIDSQNLVVCGRCLCAEHEALASARVTAQCFEYGKAAANIAVKALDSGCNIPEVIPQHIVEQMKNSGSNL